MAQLKFTLHIQRKDGKAQAQAQEIPDVFFETHNQITFAWLSEGVPATRPLHNSTIALHPNGVSISGFERESDTFHFQEWWLIPQSASVVEGLPRPEESKASVVAAPEAPEAPEDDGLLDEMDAPALSEEEDIAFHEEPIVEDAGPLAGEEIAFEDEDSSVEVVQGDAVEDQMVTVEEEMAAVDDALAPEVEEPAPMVEEEMAAVEEAPAPEAEEPAPMIEEEMAVVEEAPAPEAEEPAPMIEEEMAAVEEAPASEVEEPAPMVEEEMAAVDDALAPEAEEPALMIEEEMAVVEEAPEDGFGEESMVLPEDDLPLATPESVEEEMALEEEISDAEPEPTPPEEAVSVAQAAAKLQQVIAAGRNEAADEAQGEPKKSLEEALSGALDAAFGDEDLSSQLDSALGGDEEKPKD